MVRSFKRYQHRVGLVVFWSQAVAVALDHILVAEMAAVLLLLLVSTMAAMLVALVVPSQREARWALEQQVRPTLVAVAVAIGVVVAVLRMQVAAVDHRSCQLVVSESFTHLALSIIRQMVRFVSLFLYQPQCLPLRS